MVKNQNGGNRAKSFARKNERPIERERIRFAEAIGETYAVVTKIFGGGMCSITTIDGLKLLGHIRRKFSGRNKRNNIITSNTVVLAGLREWESTPKNCDILEVYSANEISQLKTNPKIQFEKLLQYITESAGGSSSGTKEEIGFDIGYSTTDTYEDDTEESKTGLTSIKTEKFDMEKIEEINIDDI